ncbi:sugar ABC transporter permease [Paenibacillus psychroresistens]|uniref:Sugar ABC transporter permease n=1 Tax=Paenibacillus psychroresistens TaxID=1778678 RepID=A0A6B8RGA4_9BACL|nr:ABC transporter permease subunit [Paenibacillus psychroresistens]QGQ95139.1 sugar ABC transporter permease [Paenibacillus psychroresistens]
MSQTKAKSNRRYTLITDIRKNPISYLLVLPAALYTLIYGYLTLPYMIIAFQKFNYTKGIFHSEWVGWKNFEFFFHSTAAIMVTWNTIKLNFLYILFGTIVALMFSILLNEIRSRWFKRVSQSTLLFPHFLSWIIISYVVYSLFATEHGLINNTLESLGMERFNWYAHPKPWTWILVGLNVWKETGMSAVIYLAAISAIDDSLYEAAKMDGANRWQQIKSITLPMLMPTVSILTLLAIGRIFYSDFGMIYSIIGDNGMLYSTTDVIDTYTFRTLRISGNPAIAMAIGFYQSVVGFVLVLSVNWIVKRFNKDNAMF